MGRKGSSSSLPTRFQNPYKKWEEMTTYFSYKTEYKNIVLIRILGNITKCKYCFLISYENILKEF